MSTMPMNGGYADYDLENQQLERRRKMAEMLAQQSGQGVSPGQMVGNQYVPTSWTQHLAQALKGPLAERELSRLDSQQRDVVQRKEGAMQADRQRFADLLKGTPGGTHVADDQLAYGGATGDSTTTQMPGTQGNPDAAWNFANSSRDPALRQAALAQVLSGEKTEKVGPGESLVRGGKVIFKAPERPEFGTTPQYEKDPSSPTGYVAVLYGKQGERKVIGPANPMNQFTTGTVDAANNRDLKLYEFNNLSANQRADLENRARQLGISAQELYFNTGMGYTPQGANLPPNAPPPNFTPTGAPQQPGARQPGMRPPAPAGMQVAPATQASRDQVRLQILEDELKLNPNDAALKAEVENARRGTNYAGLGAGRAPVASPVAAPAVPPPAGLTPKAAAALNAEVAGQNVQRTRDADSVLPLLDQAEKIIGGGHGSGIGNIIGGVANFTGLGLGQSSKNAVDAQMKVLAGALVSKMPKMSGPQSDKDVQLYREMAGQIGDASLPIETRKAAMQEVRRLNEKYASPEVRNNSGGATGSWGEPSQTSSGKVRVVNW